MEPITEQRQVPGLVVYGYLLTTAASPAHRAALTRALAGYCEQHELLLAAVFTDNVGDAPRAPGFTGLLDAISARASYGLVLPTWGRGRVLGSGWQRSRQRPAWHMSNRARAVTDSRVRML
jgi:hypothetical protein